MPCKTVVLAGDSPFLNSLQYRQVETILPRSGEVFKKIRDKVLLNNFKML